MKKISVIVPIHNCEANLAYSVKSIINQTYKNIEILLIENASTDKSAQICDNYEKKYSNVKTFYVNMPDLSNARNVGIENAKGEYLSFIDGDDFLYKTFYEDLVNLIETTESDIAECKLMRIPYGEDYERIIEKSNEKSEHICNLTNIEALNKYYSTNINEYVNKVVVFNKLYKKELFDDIRYPVGRIHEDESTTYKILYKASKIVETSKILYGYIQNINSIMNRPFNTKRIDDAYKAFEEAIEFFELKEEKNLEAKAKLRYLEYCVEFSYKLENSTAENKVEYKNKLYQMFRNNYKWIEFIKKYSNGEKENIIIEELQNLYRKDEKNLDIAWNLIEDK